MQTLKQFILDKLSKVNRIVLPADNKTVRYAKTMELTNNIKVKVTKTSLIISR